MEGGSTANNVSVLSQFEEERKLRSQLKDKETEVKTAQAEVDSLTASADRLSQMQTERMGSSMSWLSSARPLLTMPQLRRICAWRSGGARRSGSRWRRVGWQRSISGCSPSALRWRRRWRVLETEGGLRLHVGVGSADGGLDCSPWTSACESFGPHPTIDVPPLKLDLLSRDRQSTCDSLSAGELSLQRLRASQDEAAQRVKASKAEWDGAQSELNAAQAALAQQSAALTALHKAKPRRHRGRRNWSWSTKDCRWEHRRHNRRR